MSAAEDGLPDAEGAEATQNAQKDNLKFENDLSHAVIGAAVEVQRVLGTGLLESAYAAALAVELGEREIGFERDVAVPAMYRGRPLGVAYRADFIVERALIVQVKAVEAIGEIHRAQLLSYLRLANLKLGLLVNFYAFPVVKNVHRMVNNESRQAMKLLMIDNYDSFTYNLVQYFGELGAQVEVFRNDEITVAGVAERRPDRLVVSPGPCSPAEAGISVEAIRHFAGKLPVLGVCLGHQSIGAAFGGRIIRAQQLMHGKTSVITTNGEGVFAGLPQQFTVNRYHSLAIEKSTCPDELVTTAWTEDGEIMGVRHKELDVEGVQFHPESVLSEHGHALLKNFLERKA
jgi:anthranilate synthase component 2